MRIAPIVLLALSCKTTAPPAPSVVGAAPGFGLGFEVQMKAAMDPTADPCADFYQYACGGWVASTPLPPDRPIVVRSFTSIDDRNDAMVRRILEDAAAYPGEDPVRQKLGAFWTACNDTAAIDARGIEPVKPVWADIDAHLKQSGDLMAVLAKLAPMGFDGPFGMWVDADPKNPGLAIVHLWQAGTGLPDRDYYLEEEHAADRQAYEAYIRKLLGLAGASEADAAKQAADILAFETKLAEVQWEQVKLRDADLTYNKVDRAGLAAMTPGLDWDAYFAGRGRPEISQINVTAPSFFEGMAKLVAATDPAVLRSWLRFHVLSDASEDLAKPFDEVSFDFYGRTLFGQQQQRERWQRCVGRVDGALGDLLAAEYVEVAFPGDSKPVALDMIGRIERAFEGGLEGLAWMDADTRQRAVEKARAVSNKIGYPDVWRTYDFEVQADDHFGNTLRAEANDARYWFDKAEKPVDPNTWFMSASTVNAYYDPTQNEMAFPAGILQEPFFAGSWPKAANFGAIGSVMGHELTHGFDDEGRKFDGEGRLTDWWAPTAVEKFEEAAACVDSLYDTFEVEPGLNVNGELTLGENIADLGGLRTTYRAYKGWTAEHGEEPAVGGLTADQVLFVSFAQGWCTVASPEMQRVRAQTDPHSPGRFRVNGTVMSLPEFGAAFQCEPGTPMQPKDACEVW